MPRGSPSKPPAERRSIGSATPRGSKRSRSKAAIGAKTWTPWLTAWPPELRRSSSTDWFPGSTGPPRTAPRDSTSIGEQAQREILIVNAYIIPDDAMLQTLRGAVERGVRVRLLTNSLASNDVPAVTAKYKNYREALLDTGAELYELRAHPEIQPGVVDTAPVKAEFAGLHTKAIVVDRDTVFIGSLNLDPRSIELNTEMGMIVASPGLGEEVAAIAERDMAPGNSWRVQLDENGKLIWESVEGIVTRQPAQNDWQRFQAWVFGVLPEDQL